MSDYLVSPEGTRGNRKWRVYNLTSRCRIGTVDTRKEALQIARLLAGWQGKVTISKGGA